MLISKMGIHSPVELDSIWRSSVALNLNFTDGKHNELTVSLFGETLTGFRKKLAAEETKEARKVMEWIRRKFIPAE